MKLKNYNQFILESVNIPDLPKNIDDYVLPLIDDCITFYKRAITKGSFISKYDYHEIEYDKYDGVSAIFGYVFYFVFPIDSNVRDMLKSTRHIFFNISNDYPELDLYYRLTKWDRYYNMTRATVIREDVKVLKIIMTDDSNNGIREECLGRDTIKYIKNIDESVNYNISDIIPSVDNFKYYLQSLIDDYSPNITTYYLSYQSFNGKTHRFNEPDEPTVPWKTLYGYNVYLETSVSDVEEVNDSLEYIKKSLAIDYPNAYCSVECLDYKNSVFELLLVDKKFAKYSK